MGRDSKIAWCDHTFSIAWGCAKVSPGCTNCYADTLAGRWGHDVWGPKKPRRTMSASYWREPLRWNRAAAKAGETARVFCSSMCDVFEDHPTIDAERAKLWPLIRETPHLTWLLLTKRADRIAAQLPKPWPIQNVWLGVSVESRDYLSRVAHLRAIPAARRFISYEPALGPIAPLDLRGIDWVIVGGESGPRHRVMDPQWAREVCACCVAQGASFFFKQHSGRRPEERIDLDGAVIRRVPA